VSRIWINGEVDSQARIIIFISTFSHTGLSRNKDEPPAGKAAVADIIGIYGISQKAEKEDLTMKLWERITRGMEAGFDAALAAVHNVTEKAGEGIEVTKLRREKARYETALTRLLAELGNAVYEKISENRLNEIAEKLAVKDKILEIAQNEARIVDIDRKLEIELKQQATVK